MSRDRRDQRGGHPLRHPSYRDCLCCENQTRRDAEGPRAQAKKRAVDEQVGRTRSRTKESPR